MVQTAADRGCWRELHRRIWPGPDSPDAAGVDKKRAAASLHQPVRRRPRIQWHSRQAPERHQNRALRRLSRLAKRQVAFPARLSPPEHIAGAPSNERRSRMSSLSMTGSANSGASCAASRDLPLPDRPEITTNLLLARRARLLSRVTLCPESPPPRCVKSPSVRLRAGTSA